MKTLFHIKKYWLLLLCMVLFLVHQLLQKIMHLPLRFADNFLDPFLLPPIILSFLVFERRILQKKSNDYILPFIDAIAAIALIAIFSEWLFPYWNKGFTRDIWDLVAFALGTSVFLLWMNKPYPNYR